jgi:ParB-like chromosome segregation protein Spo0J
MEMNLEYVPIGRIKPNPFRELGDYPIDREKVDRLKESIKATGFWPIVARRAESNFEIAFGHHRVHALKELIDEGHFKKTEKFPLNICEMSNEEMLQKMARENLEEWETNAYVEVQTIESTIRAYGNGLIELPKVPKDTNKCHIRNAAQSSVQRPYTKDSVAKFLGWTRTRTNSSGVQPNNACNTAFEIIDAIELGIVKRDQFKKIKRDIAREIVTKAMALYREQERIAKQRADAAAKARQMAEQEEDARKAKALQKLADEQQRQADAAKDAAEDVAKDFAKEMMGEVKAGNMSQRDVRREGDARKADMTSKRETTAKDAKKHVEGFRKLVMAFLNDAQDERFASIVQLIEGDFGLEQSDIKQLREEVVYLKARCDSFAKLLGAWRPSESDKSESSRLLKVVG